MEITSSLTPEEVVAKVMMAARDPDLEAVGGVDPRETAAGGKVRTASAPPPPRIDDPLQEKQQLA
jgi:hypothetical protein